MGLVLLSNDADEVVQHDYTAHTLQLFFFPSNSPRNKNSQGFGNPSFMESLNDATSKFTCQQWKIKCFHYAICTYHKITLVLKKRPHLLTRAQRLLVKMLFTIFSNFSRIKA
ncbi:hypothetical protein XENTR_v10006173 [Xenopus tropicalis]|nr:hypothetical protein XENTR_v10006173 [Xenopus tropicalis]